MSDFSLLPMPRSIDLTTGQYEFEAGRFILLQAEEPSQLLFSAKALQAALQQYAGTIYPISASSVGPEEEIGIVLRLSDNPSMLEKPEQGYELTITPERITAVAQTPAGIFYAVCSLIQLVKQYVKALPGAHISDWPDFPVRGFMLDVSRDKVPTMPTLLSLIDKLANWKMNQLQLYTEHTFAYRNHHEVWEKASPLTGQEILELDAYCKERFIELVPNQNSFGHMHRWLIHPRYSALAEVTEGFTAPWGYIKGPFSLDPTNPASLELVSSLFDELLPHFSSRQVNIGCDETFDLGQGKSKAACDEFGKYRVYLDFLTKISTNLLQRGYTVQFWGDIVLEHPEVISQIPKGVVALDWGYEEDHPFELECSRFEEAGIPFYVCPGTSAWCSLGGRTKNALGNLLNAAEAGLKHGASGYLITDWGDRGHWQTLPVSYPGIVAGAALSWALEANRELDMPDVLNQQVFDDKSEVMGKLAYDLGNVYLLPGLQRHNSSQLFWLLQYSPVQLQQVLQETVSKDGKPDPSLPGYIPETTLTEALKLIDQVMLPLSESQMNLPDANIIKQEYQIIAQLMRLACWRGLVALENPEFRDEYSSQLPVIIEDYQKIWLNRNRPGGLSDSIAALKKLQI